MRRRIAGTVVISMLALAFIGIAMTLGAPAGPTENPKVALTSSGLTMRNSKSGQPVVGAANIKPGDRLGGVVRIHVGGSAADVQVSAVNVSDTVGPNGGPLSGRLIVGVNYVPESGPVQVVYRGPLSGLDDVGLGHWTAGETRKYRVRVVFANAGLPPSSTGRDNRYQGSSASFDLVWNATGV